MSTVRRLASLESWSFEIDARGAEILRVAAIGDGDTDVDLTVRDAAGRVLCADGLGDHYPVCTLAPEAPARLRVDFPRLAAPISMCLTMFAFEMKSPVVVGKSGTCC